MASNAHQPPAASGGGTLGPPAAGGHEPGGIPVTDRAILQQLGEVYRALEKPLPRFRVFQQQHPELYVEALRVLDRERRLSRVVRGHVGRRYLGRGVVNEGVRQ